MELTISTSVIETVFLFGRCRKVEGGGKCGGRCRDVLEVVWKSVEEVWGSVLWCEGGEKSVVKVWGVWGSVGGGVGSVLECGG